MEAAKPESRPRGRPSSEDTALRAKTDPPALNKPPKGWEQLTPDEVKVMLPRDIFRVLAHYYARMGDLPRLERVASVWAPYEHPKRTEAVNPLTAEELRRFAEASRRGLDDVPSNKPPPGALPH
jgi:hypothetical protein